MITITQKWKGKKIEAIAQEIEYAVKSALNALAVGVWNKARDFAPRRTGNLKRSIILAPSDYEYAIQVGAGYGEYVEFGTSPHIITPKRAKALHWISEGKHIFRKKVHHPGTKGQYFMKRAFEWGKEQVDPIFSKHISVILK